MIGMTGRKADLVKEKAFMLHSDNNIPDYLAPDGRDRHRGQHDAPRGRRPLPSRAERHSTVVPLRIQRLTTRKGLGHLGIP